MIVAQNTAVTLKYSVTDADGNMVDEGETPLVYLHGGYDNIFPKLEEELNGKAVGASIVVRLEPEDAFGEYDADLVLVQPVTAFPPGIQVGMQLQGREKDSTEVMIYTVTNIEGDSVVVDGNHPLAGRTIIFTATVAEVRPATQEEIDHRHIHGPDGHHHH